VEDQDINQPLKLINSITTPFDSNRYSNQESLQNKNSNLENDNFSMISNLSPLKIKRKIRK
jgi:hypothetical protein